MCVGAMSGEIFLAMISGDPSVPESSQVHIHIFRFSIYSIDSSKMIGNFLGVLNFN